MHIAHSNIAKEETPVTVTKPVAASFADVENYRVLKLASKGMEDRIEAILKKRPDFLKTLIYK